MERAHVVVVGAGAAGLMAAIHAGRAAPGRRILALDGSPRLGAKILIAGGGRCNVTHDVVDETAYAGSTRPAIRKVLRSFDVASTVAFFESIGVRLKREETGKLFPVTDRARTVLDALLGAAAAAGVQVRHPCRVDAIEARGDGFHVRSAALDVRAAHVVLATGGQSVPQTGSDGHGYEIARSLGHETTRLLPALVPLLLPAGHPLTAIRGVSTEARVRVLARQGRSVVDVTGPVLLTHVGLSGPAILDASRWWLDLVDRDPEARFVISWLGEASEEVVDRWLSEAGGERLLARLAARIPRRLAEVLLARAGLPPETRGSHLAREARRRLASLLAADGLPIQGSRGFAVAEATAGGVPLREVHLDRMESRRRPGLFLCGEILDVDGRIGGYNFQWAWSSGWLAGRGAAAA